MMPDEFRVTPVPFNGASVAQAVEAGLTPVKKMLQQILAKLDALEASRTQANSTQSRRHTS